MKHISIIIFIILLAQVLLSCKAANMPVVLPLQPSIEFLRAMKIRNEQDTNIKKASDERISPNEHHKGEVDDMNGKEQHAIFSKMHPKHWAWLGASNVDDDKAEF